MSGFIPNSFQHPNAYVDQFMHLLTGEEHKVLTYTIRRIIGFQKRQDRISISQYASGTMSADGQHLDYGTGLSIDAIRNALAVLIRSKLMIVVAENDPKTNEGKCYALQLDSSKVNLDYLTKRAKTKKASTKERMAVIRQARKKSASDGPLCATEGDTSSAPQNAPLLPHRTPPFCETETQNTVETQKETQSLGADAPNQSLSPSQERKLTERQIMLKRLEEVFVEITGRNLPPRKTERERKEAGVRWWNPLWHMYEIAGKDLDRTIKFMSKTFQQMRVEKLTVSCPQSIEQTFISVVGDTKLASAGISPLDEKTLARQRELAGYKRPH